MPRARTGSNGNRRGYLRKRASRTTSTRLPRSRLRAIITPSSSKPERLGERPRGRVVGRRGDLDPLELELLEGPLDEQRHRRRGRRRGRAPRARASSRPRRACGATPRVWSITWPRNGRLVASVTARPRNSPRARRPGWRAMKRRTPFSVGSSSAPISTPSCGSSRNAAANGAGVARAQAAQRDAVALEALRDREARHCAREPNARWYVRARCAASSSSLAVLAVAAAAATRARTRTSPRASSRSRSSTRRSRGASTSPRTSS